MQPATSLAAQTPVLALLQLLPTPAAPVSDKQPVMPNEFGDALTKLLAAAAPSDQQPPAPDIPVSAAKTAADPQPVTPTQQAATQPAQGPVQQLQPPAPAPALAPAPTEMPVVPPLPLPDTTQPVLRNSGGKETSREAPTARRSMPAHAAAAPATVLQQPIAQPVIPPQLPVITPAPEQLSGFAVPAPTHASAHQQPDVPEANNNIRPAAMTPAFATLAQAKPIETAVPPPMQELPMAAPTQPAAAAPTELAAQVLPAQAEPPPQPAQTAERIAAPASQPHAAASPAEQVAPALVQMGHAPDGAQRLTVRLDPPELGHVQVRIDRPPEAPARVEITVEKPETLTLLLRDQPQLQRALDQAGVPAEGRSLTFHLASSDAAPRSDPATAPAPGVAAGGLSGDGSHGAPRQGGQPARQEGDAQDGNDTDFAPIAAPGWMRAGLDITA